MPIIINELTQSLRSIEQQLAEESNKKGEAPELRSLEEVFSGIQSGRLPFTEKIRNYVYQKFSVDLNGNFVLILAYLGGHYEEERKRMVPSLLSLLRKSTSEECQMLDYPAFRSCLDVYKRQGWGRGRNRHNGIHTVPDYDWDKDLVLRPDCGRAPDHCDHSRQRRRWKSALPRFCARCV